MLGLFQVIYQEFRRLSIDIVQGGQEWNHSIETAAKGIEYYLE